MQVERNAAWGAKDFPAIRAEHPLSAMHGQCAVRKAGRGFFRRLRCAGLRL
ncbi:MAG: hypothetical protein LBU42_08385 [Prevotellaceae bacterium]|nr:hypothetical protein [Prevotellaceae bacterium]